MNDLEIPKNRILHLLYIPSKKTKGGFVHSLSFVRPPPRLNPDRFNPRVTCELSPHVDRIACPHANSWCNTEPDRSKKNPDWSSATTPARSRKNPDRL